MSNHSARNIKRGCLKRCQWPTPYWAKVRVLDKTTLEETSQWLAFLLPHELIEMMHRLGTPGALLSTDDLDDVAMAHLRYCREKAGQDVVPLGLWGDGVPVNWDRTESVETVSLNLPGKTGEYSTLRIPLTAISRKQVGEHTWDDICAVLHWSLVRAADGNFPSVRHDGTPFRKSDSYRKKRLVQPSMGYKAALVEVRGDWKFFAEVFRFPKWNENAGLCWRCSCTPDQVF